MERRVKIGLAAELLEPPSRSAANIKDLICREQRRSSDCERSLDELGSDREVTRVLGTPAASLARTCRIGVIRLSDPAALAGSGVIQVVGRRHGGELPARLQATAFYHIPRGLCATATLLLAGLARELIVGAAR